MGLPGQVFNRVAPDGSRARTFHIQNGYNSAARDGAFTSPARSSPSPRTAGGASDRDPNPPAYFDFSASCALSAATSARNAAISPAASELGEPPGSICR